MMPAGKFAAISEIVFIFVAASLFRGMSGLSEKCCRERQACLSGTDKLYGFLKKYKIIDYDKAYCNVETEA